MNSQKVKSSSCPLPLRENKGNLNLLFIASSNGDD